jgi:putative hydrolase of the HAD superfamily
MRAVIFDLGDTLIRPIGPWEPVLTRASRALARTLSIVGVGVDHDAFADAFAAALRRYNIEREVSLRESTTLLLLRDVLENFGAHMDDGLLHSTLQVYYSTTRTNWRPADDGLPTLRALAAVGLHLGLLSNAGDDADVRILAQESGFAPLLDFVVTSAQVGLRKPHPRAFEAALAHWPFAPSEVAMVGDRLDADVAGAQQMGLFGIWLHSGSSPQFPTATSSQTSPEPDAIIKSLSQLPGMLIR